MENKTYELTIVLPSKSAEKKAVALVEGLLKKSGGKIVSNEFWGSKELAYDIDKQNKAEFTFFELELTPSEVNELNKRLNLEEGIMRYLLVEAKKNKVIKSKKKNKKAKSEK